jgi:acyl-coenzyme A synthetase/AMP-(fatty) acid ligase
MLKVGGIGVSPVEIENILIQHPIVLESAVVGTADADGLIKPKAFVVLSDPSKANRDRRERPPEPLLTSALSWRAC